MSVRDYQAIGQIFFASGTESSWNFSSFQSSSYLPSSSKQIADHRTGPLNIGTDQPILLVFKAVMEITKIAMTFDGPSVGEIVWLR